MERTPRRARPARIVKTHPLRYSSAPGIRAWSALPQRDRSLLRWLLSGTVVTSELAALLLYREPRTARRRLARMVAYGLVRGYWAANSQRPRGRFAYALTGMTRDALERVAHRPRSSGRRTATAMPTIHQLATLDLLAALLTAAEPARGQGLTAWLSERAIRELFDDFIRPDALAIIGVPGRRISLFIERDLSTETATIVAGKVTRYRSVLGKRPDQVTNLGLVLDSHRRVRSVLSRLPHAALGTLPNVWLTTAQDLLADPLHAIWLSPDSDRRSTLELPSEPAPAGVILGVQCLLDPEAIEAFEVDPARVPVLGSFLPTRRG